MIHVGLLSHEPISNKRIGDFKLAEIKKHLSEYYNIEI